MLSQITSVAPFLLCLALVAFPGVVSAQADEEASEEEASDEASPEDAAIDETEAHAIFELAQIHYSSGRFTEAAEGFQRAYDLSQRPALLYNIYLAKRDNGDVQGAHDALAAFLSESDDMPNRRLMERRLESLQRQIETGEPAPTDLPDDEMAADPQTDGDDAADTDPGTETDDSSGGGSVLPWVLVGTGGALLVGALIFNRLSAGQQSDLDENCPDDRCPVSYDAEGVADDIRLYNALGWSFLAAGVVAAGVGLTLMFVGSDDDEPAVSGGCGPDGCGLSVRGRF